MSDFFYSAVVVGIVALLTWFCRVVPFMIFGGNKKIPEMVTYLGTVLPSTVMVVLVLYGIRGIKLTEFPYGASELFSIGLIIVLQYIKRNTIFSILAGTACYMILLRVL